ncbi:MULTISPECIES: D-Ala-D-Ala carboxypeptidase family metallohydrolase [Sphingomonas]|uniref:D-Ala-D-Ala carboxypeptidase family metallohydrolase n=1 Tax=Sphingomonas TaxID=13687 RepID=UPI000DEF8719|nr:MULTISPECIES: D-Ala-D-Ala carboxypeptidase family metallohydrolase [Sphingomonas]
MPLLPVLLALAQPTAAAASIVPPFRVGPPVWNPTGDYVIAGQDEAGYRRWIGGQSWRPGLVASFHRYLMDNQVGFVVPTWQLLRTASDWAKCGAEPFEVPPITQWANVIQTLRYVRDYVVPAIGPVEAVSAYRNPILNQCAGGAPESVHMTMSAIDLVPLLPIDRGTLMSRLCSGHAINGPRYNVGLGFYTKLRFHVDSWKYRTWGRNDGGTLACPSPIVRAAPPAPAVTVVPTAIQPASPSSDPLAPR